jgi:hypothetical protein
MKFDARQEIWKHSKMSSKYGGNILEIQFELLKTNLIDKRLHELFHTIEGEQTPRVMRIVLIFTVVQQTPVNTSENSIQ